MKTLNLKLRQGDKFVVSVLYGEKPLVYKQVTAIERSAPARLTVPAHGLTIDGWPVAVTNVVGMKEINAVANEVVEADFHPATIVDADTIEFNDVNAAGFKAYVSGGILQYYSPVDLTDYVAHMTIRDKVGGNVLASSKSVDAPLDVIGVSINPATSTITARIFTEDSADFAWVKAVYDIEVVDAAGQATTVCAGVITVDKQVTT